MAYLGSFKIDDYLIIPAATHRFSSGAAYAPTSLTWTCYEDDSTTHLFENVDMTVASPFDSIVGFYIYKQQLTTAAGFEKGKSYTIVIKATVDSVAAIDYHTFQIGPAPVDVTQWNGTAIPGVDTAGYPKVTVKSGTGTGEVSLSSGLVRLSGTGVDDILDEVYEGTHTLRQLLRLTASALFSKVSGGGTATITFRDVDDSKNRIVATVDANGNRTAITLTEA